MKRLLLIAALLSACTSADPAMGDEVTCESFGNDPTYVYANGNVTIDLTDVDELQVLGVLFAIAPGFKPAADDQPVMTEIERWSVRAINWDGRIGRAVQVRAEPGDQECRAVWVDRL